ncbi:hypothetical protein CONCODRAFT_13439 [Conidiobolus coronatus NRRL 28638]|uniref:Uncharacterized protein n=1 Tax=Conidiobolus coronatus (strain ATCC 28846 / CBS 209.66 / NRRL 28638) TaxID=796925 RepID=A0A137NQQ9_CONC2|nr:hypothetical protein CONCODRAFT_13439 [Conidiobolus coronatus NRRL 28638]|eukprot:KXN65097.1 hypothetical protein CONCODRAFT_13439 [Conidiobolus coronatus NRRL 28638]
MLLILKNELPYIIPCLVASIISIIAAFISHFYLDKTLGNNTNTLLNSELITKLRLTVSKDSDFILNGLSNTTFIFSGFTTIVKD